MIVLRPRGGRVLTDEAYAGFAPMARPLAQLLYARGVGDSAQAQAFLHPSLDQLNDPFLLAGMKPALDILKQAKESGTRVMVYGDYDVDGMCATSIMVLALRRYGLDADYAVPLREEGYGLNLPAVEALSKQCGVLVTVDLGISNRAEVARARELGLRVIVSDHHQLPIELCEADAIIHPLLGEYPCRTLCGAGVALKTAQALLGLDIAKEYLDLAALATVADMVELLGENRAIVAMGLTMLTAGERVGIAALKSVSGLEGEVNTGHLGFQLAPRLNAAGRLQDARLGIELLLTKDANEAARLATQLDEANTERKRVEQQMLRQAQEQALGYDFIRNPVLIVRGKDWHAGIIGLVAGRLCQQYACPVMALCEDGDELHGSLRSVKGVHIQKMLTLCDDLLTRYGGHEMAAGVTVKAENYDAFCERLCKAVRDSADESAFLPAQEYDVVLPLSSLDRALLGELKQLEPFGMGNPAPLMLSTDLSVDRRRACGAAGAHLQLTLRGNQAAVDGIAFGQGALERTLTETVDCVYALKENTYMGRTSLQLDVKALCPAKGAQADRLTRMDGEVFAKALLDGLNQIKPDQITPDSGITAGKTANDSEVLLNIGKACPPIDRGTLFVARTRETALAFLGNAERPLDVCCQQADDPRCLPTLLVCPDMAKATGLWRKVVLLDGAITPDEPAIWRQLLTDAQVFVCPTSAPLCALAASLDAGDERARSLYKLVRGTLFSDLAQLASAIGLTPSKTLTALTAFCELKLIDYQPAPFQIRLLPPVKCKLGDSPTLAMIRRLSTGKEAS